MDLNKILESQYLAALAMFKQAVVHCPPSLWDAPQDTFKFWSKSYHVLYFVHLYLQSAEKDFVPWIKHHDPDGDIPFTKDEVLEYLTVVEQEVVKRVPITDFEAESGFDWYPVNKLELQFINIRHIQQHTGELYEYLGIHESIELGWVGFSRALKEKE